MADGLPSQPETIRYTRAPEVFVVLEALMRPAPVSDTKLPKLSSPIRPYVPVGAIAEEQADACQVTPDVLE